MITYCFGISVFIARTSHTSFISIFSPVCRNLAKQTFLETLQDNLIEMDILASARHDATYNDGYVACPLSDSDCCQSLLCHENTSDACTISFLHEYPVFRNAVSHHCMSPAVLESLLYLSLPCYRQLTACIKSYFWLV